MTDKSVQQQPSHISPQEPLDSSRPTNNSIHQKPSLPSQRSAKGSSQLSSTKTSSSSSSTKKPQVEGSLSSLLANQNTIKWGLVVKLCHNGQRNKAFQVKNRSPVVWYCHLRQGVAERFTYQKDTETSGHYEFLQ